MFRPKARKSDQVQMHLLPPRCCFALAALVWPATEASLTFRTALGTVDLGLLQQPNSQQAHHLKTCLAVGKPSLEHYNKTKHTYNHIYIYYI